MKKLIAAGALALTAVAAQAQVSFESDDNAPYFGVRLGLDITCPGDIKNDKFSVDLYKAGAGFDAGVIYNIPLWKNLYFEPGAKFYYSTMGCDFVLGDALVTETKASVRRFGVRVPFRVGYRFDFATDYLSAISVFTGPQLEIGIIGREHISATVDGISETMNENCFTDNGFKRTDLGWQFGVGFHFGSWIAEIAGTVGMLDLQPGPASYHQGNVTISLGYNF